MRFSVKAVGPSLASLLMNTFMPMLESILHRLGLGQALGLTQRSQHGLHRQRARWRDPVGDLARLVERLAVGHDVADEPDLLGLGRRTWRPVRSISAATV